MSKNLAILDDNDMSSLPAHIAKAFGSAPSFDDDALTGGLLGGFPVISIKGKRFAINEGGVTTIITRPDADGEDAPVSALQVVIVKANPHLSKVYYANGYIEGSEDKPTCYSNKGIAPEGDAEEPQAKSCAACPHNQWGSRISESGAKGKACADSRRMAVVPVGELDRPMMLRIPAATLRELANYADGLKRRNAPYQAIVTRISFDNTVAFPKLQFKAMRWLDAKELVAVQELMTNDILGQIVGTSEGVAVSAPQTTQQRLAVDSVPAHPKNTDSSDQSNDKAVTTTAKRSPGRPRTKPAPTTESSDTLQRMESINSALDDVLAIIDD